MAAAEGWLLDDSRPQYELIVPVASERSQSVRVQFDCRDELGRLILVYTSPCGSLSAAKAAMALRHNARRHLLCFAVDKVEQKRLLVLKAIQASDLVTEAGVRELVLLIARDADRVELQLTGRDAY